LPYICIMLSKEKSKIYPCIIAVAEDGFKCLVDSGKGNFIGHEIFDSIDLNVELNNGIGLPDKRGVYTCNITVGTYNNGHPLDPVEMDFEFEVSNIKQVDCWK